LVLDELDKGRRLLQVAGDGKDHAFKDAIAFGLGCAIIGGDLLLGRRPTATGEVMRLSVNME
jgi:hypothetical protein